MEICSLKMDKVSLETLVKNIDTQLFELISHVICSICQELLNKPVTTPCGHSFCNGCIKRVLLSKDNSGCPLCKNPVKRYSLEADKVKLTLSDICRELPTAFEKDVKDLSSHLKDGIDDLIRSTKVAQLSSNQDNPKQFNEQKTLINNKNPKPNAKNFEADANNDADTFLPVLKRSKKVIEYLNPRMQKTDDFVSISQMEVASGSSVSGSSELERKLEKIEKIKPEEKVKEWFNAVGDNIYFNSPTSSPFQSNNAEEDGKEVEEEERGKVTSVIRRDYKKSGNPVQSKENAERVMKDPYEFIPSQNNRLVKKKRQRKSLGKVKKIPDFKSLQSFTKESIRRNTIILNDDKEEGDEDINDEAEDLQRNKLQLITASQKFDQLLSEDKEKSKTYMLYSGSQSSSTQFLDCSFHSQMETDKKISPGISKKGKPPEIGQYPHVQLFVDNASLDKPKARISAKRKRTFNGRKDCGTKSFSEIMNLKSPEALELEKSVEKYLMGCKANTVNVSKDEARTESTSDSKETQLIKLLIELSNDDVIYPKGGNIPLKLPKNITDNLSNCEYASPCSELPFSAKVLNLIRDNSSQNTDLIGFCTQEELPEEKRFKQMVEKLESELNSEELDLVEEKEAGSVSSSEANKEVEGGKSVVHSTNPPEGEKDSAQANVVRFDWAGRIKQCKNSLVDFLHLGRMTPTIKRSKMSVVKLVFPIGFSSFAKKRALKNRNAVGVPILQPVKACSLSLTPDQKETFQVSASIQTSQRMVSSAVIQTSQVLHSSANIQTSQEIKPSVEIQTSQEWTSCAGIQTSQRINPSVEIQTSQRFVCKSAGIQTSQIPPDIEQTFKIENERQEFWDEGPLKDDTSRKFSTDEISSPIYSKQNEGRTPQRKSFVKNRKIVKKRSSQDETSTKPRSPETPRESKTLSENYVTPQENPINDLIMDFEMENEFEKTWLKNTQKPHEGPVVFKSKKSREESEKSSPEKSDSDRQSDDSDIRPPKRSKHSRKIVFEESTSPVKAFDRFETLQMIPLDVRKVSLDEEIAVVDLRGSQEEDINAKVQMLKVLKNIDLDMAIKRKVENYEKTVDFGKGEKSEESDSDFFVEQTPPRLKNSRIEQPFRSASRCGIENIKSNSREDGGEAKKTKKDLELASEETDLIEDSEPKGLRKTESFLLLSAPQKTISTRKKGRKDVDNPDEIKQKEVEAGKTQSKARGFPREEFFSSIQKPDENDQNQLNALQEDTSKKSETKSSAQSKTISDVWKRSEDSPQSKTEAKKSVRIVASSVKNSEVIKKFTSRFRLEYLTKPVKDMTHLVVGLHENEEGEILPLCTPKLLFAMANKKWIVSESWAETCLKMNMMLPEDTFETLDPVGGTACRKARLSSDELLKNCEVYLLGNFQMISKEEFADLILDCGGTLVSKPEKFSFSPTKMRMIIADRDCLTLDENQLRELYEKFETVILSRDVIIMSIQSYRLANFFPYLLHVASEEDLTRIGYPPSLVKQEEEDSNWDSAK